MYNFGQSTEQDIYEDPWLNIFFVTKEKRYQEITGDDGISRLYFMPETARVDKGNYFYLCAMAKGGWGKFQQAQVKKLNGTYGVDWKDIGYKDVWNNINELAESTKEGSDQMQNVFDVVLLKDYKVPEAYQQMVGAEKLKPSENPSEVVQQERPIELIEQAGMTAPFNIMPLILIGGLFFLLRRKRS